MAWTIRIAPRALKEIEKLGSVDRERVLRFLYERVAPSDNPRKLGTLLTGSKGELWRYRVGDIRVICTIEQTQFVVTVVTVGNRREVYR